MTFTPTAEQAAILAAFTDGRDLVIQAGAGTGKTTTLKLLANSTPRLGTYLAFNKAIQVEASQSMPSTVRCKTAHGLAWQEHGNQYADRMNAARPAWSDVINFLNTGHLTVPGYDGRNRSLTAYQSARLVLDTVKGFCQSADPTITAAHIPTVPGVTGPGGLGGSRGLDKLADYLLPRARNAWADIQRTAGVLAYDHSYYLKLWALTEPTIGGDYLMFDEAQDASEVVSAVVNAQTHLQRVFVGDSSQSIYGFAGAHDSMRKFARRDGVVTLSLSESFRFGPEIATAANGLLDKLGAPLRITGTPAITSTLTVLDPVGATGPRADAVLCRTNAGALDEVINTQAAGRKVCLVGNADELRRFVEAARELQDKGSTNFHALMAFDSWAEVQDYVDQDPSGADLATMVDLVDTYGAATLLDALRKCVKEERADVVVSTAHKAKGREWDTVRISKDFALSEDLHPDVLKAELMLAYVSVTRARYGLDPGLLRPWLGRQPAPATSPFPASAPAPAHVPTQVPLPVPAPMDWTVPTAGDAFAIPIPIPIPATVAAAQARIEDTAELPDLMDGEHTHQSSDPSDMPPTSGTALVLHLDDTAYANLTHVADRLDLTPEDFAARLLTGALAGLTR